MHALSRVLLLTATLAFLPVLSAEDAGALPPVIPAPDHPDTGIRLTLEQCVAEALARNFSVRISAYSADQARQSVTIAQSAYDPVLGVQWKRVVNKSPDVLAETVVSGSGGQSVIATYPYSSSQQTEVTATQNLPTGGQVTAGYILGRDFSTPASLFLNPAYTGNVSLTVSQPLLQGAGTAYARAAIDLARLGERVAGLNLKSTALTLIFNVETAYYDLAFARRQYQVAKDNLRLAQQLVDENTTKRQNGVLTDLDVVQAQAGAATAQSQLIGFRQAMENAEDNLLQAMGERNFQSAVGSIEVPPAPESAVSFDISYKLARDHGPSLAIADATIEQYRLEALRAKRNVLPQLSLVGGGGRTTNQPSYGNAFDQVWNGPGYNWQAGLTFSLPWGLRSARAQYRQAMDNVHAGQLAYDQADQALVVQVRAAVRAVEANRQAVAAAAQAALLSGKQYDLQRAKFDSGLATSYDVLQAQYQWESARASQIQAEVNFRVAMADLQFLEGTSLDRYRVDLKY